MVTGDEKWITFDNTGRKDRGESVVKQLIRWSNQDLRPGRFYWVFGGIGKESFIMSCFNIWPNNKFRSLLSTTGPFEASDWPEMARIGQENSCCVLS
ncbi:hypothetical protein TNCV_4162041 [Trichonephila clavipes]|nr:hypothetical protein TNCV_4162041 [Trichonephila clavipes]